MKWKLYSHNFAKPKRAESDRGFTLVELLAALTVGMLLLGLTMATTLSNRNLYQDDLARTRLNQNLRGALDIMGVNVREAGENLSAIFPAVDIVDGGGENPDQLTLRRNLRDEVLKLCTPITAGSTVNEVYFATEGATPGCTYSSNHYSFTSWQTYRTENDDEVRAYIYDTTAEHGEFFNYTGETDTGTELFLETDGGTWLNSYAVESSSIYLIEQWHFRLGNLSDGTSVLELVENGDEDNPMNVVPGITGFQVAVVMPDDTIYDDIQVDDNWTDVKAFQITLTGQDSSLGQGITRSLTSRYFPRNVLSN